MQRSNPVGRWFSVIANLPIIGQLSHREQLILNRSQVLVLDRVTVSDTARRQAPRADPATDRLRVLADTVGGLSYGQHAQMVRAAADPWPRDQVKSPWYWAALPAMGLFFLFGGFQGVGAIFYVVAIALIQMSRRAARRKTSS